MVPLTTALRLRPSLRISFALPARLSCGCPARRVMLPFPLHISTNETVTAEPKAVCPLMVAFSEALFKSAENIGDEPAPRVGVGDLVSV